MESTINLPPKKLGKLAVRRELARIGWGHP